MESDYCGDAGCANWAAKGVATQDFGVVVDLIAVLP